jgi:hypothetical protein
MKMKHYYIMCCFVLLCSNSLRAQPVVGSMFTVNEQAIYKDAVKNNVYYYIPPAYQLATDAEGKPDFTLTQLRYTGTQATGDVGVKKFHNRLQFRIVIDTETYKKFNALKIALKKINTNAILQPLPVRKFYSILAFTSIHDGVMLADSGRIVKISHNEVTDANATINNSYWNERTVVLKLTNEDAMLIEAALKNNQSAISFSYAMYTAFIEKNARDLFVQGNSILAKQVKDYFKNELEQVKDSVAQITMIQADAINLVVDINKWSELIKKVDINEKLPAKYALFDVYCYDFNNNLRPDLFSKKIEIKAISVNGNEVISAFSFKQTRPDLYAKSLRFAYAVRFDKPIHYRVTEIDNNGEVNTTQWKLKKEWSDIIDVTSSAEKIITQPKEVD